MKIKHKDIEDILGFQVSSELRNRIDEYNLEYRYLTKDERDEYILNFINVITNDITVSGEHRLMEWEKGWSENLNKFKRTLLLIPPIGAIIGICLFIYFMIILLIDKLQNYFK
jgi:hypothetical protein